MSELASKRWMNVGKVCVLCNKDRPIKNSHIIPKFVFRWMISTGGTKFLRHGATPNRRVQDGLKYPIFCKNCEISVSKFEDQFSRDFFKPSTSNKPLPKKTQKTTYDFVASVHLRVLSYLSIEGKSEDLSEEQINATRDAIDMIGEYLFNQRHSCLPVQFFLIPFGLGSPNSMLGKPSNWNRYIRRHTELDLIVSEKGSLFGSYFKIGPWVSFALIKNESQPWIGCEIYKTANRFHIGRSIFPPTMLDFLEERARTAQRTLAGISPTQKKVIEKAILEGDFANEGREMFDAILADYEAFGDDAFGN